MRTGVLLAASLAALTLGACQKAAAGPDDDAFGRKVRAYLLAHPEVIQEAVQALQTRQAAEDAAAEAKAKADLPKLRAALERDPRDFVANPGGKITVVEFFDYRCPHCANIAPKVVDLIRHNPNVRFVFKEMPIFGPTSRHAAVAAMAVKSAGGDYVGLYDALMRTHPLDDGAIDRIALRMGAKTADLAPSTADKSQLDATTALFSKLNLGGTPAFIVGDEIIYGEDIEGLNAAVAKAGA